MFSVLTALLLAGAEPSSYGFLTYGISSPLHGDTSRGYATNVVHLHVNDSTSTSMNVELLCLRMDYQHGSHTLDGLRGPLTTSLRPSQPEEVHPLGCTMLTNQTIFGQDSLTTCDQRPRLGNAICHASPRVHRSHHALAAPAKPVELSCAIAAPAEPVELSCAPVAPAEPVELSYVIAAPDLSVELSYAVGLPAHGHYSTQHHKVSTYCLDNNTSKSMPMSTPMRTPVSTPAAPIAALDTRIAPTQPLPSPNVMMTTKLDNGAAMSDPLRPARHGYSDTGHTATALCSCNVHRSPAPNADTNKSMTTTRPGRRPPSTYSVALPAALLLSSGTTQQIESDLTNIAASNPTTIVAAQPRVTAGPSLWLSQSCSTECREGPPSQAPADHANVPTYLARRGSRCSLQCILRWNSSCGRLLSLLRMQHTVPRSRRQQPASIRLQHMMPRRRRQ